MINRKSKSEREQISNAPRLSQNDADAVSRTGKWRKHLTHKTPLILHRDENASCMKCDAEVTRNADRKGKPHPPAVLSNWRDRSHSFPGGFLLSANRRSEGK
jgi:hypothetical protein